MSKILHTTKSWLIRFSRKRTVQVIALLILLNIGLSYLKQQLQPIRPYDQYLAEQKQKETEQNRYTTTIYKKLQAGMGESYSNDIQSKLMQLFAIHKGLFTHEQVAQIFKIKFTKFDQQYSYDDEEIHLEIKPSTFSFAWHKTGQEVSDMPIGNCMSYEAFKTVLTKVGWQKVWPQAKLIQRDERISYDQLYNYKNPRRWMLIDVNTQFDCIENIVVYDTKIDAEPEITKPPPKTKPSPPPPPSYDYKTRGVD